MDPMFKQRLHRFDALHDLLTGAGGHPDGGSAAAPGRFRAAAWSVLCGRLHKLVGFVYDRAGARHGEKRPFGRPLQSGPALPCCDASHP